jgi:hypothetical protein
MRSLAAINPSLPCQHFATKRSAIRNQSAIIRHQSAIKPPIRDQIARNLPSMRHSPTIHSSLNRQQSATKPTAIRHQCVIHTPSIRHQTANPPSNR